MFIGATARCDTGNNTALFPAQHVDPGNTLAGPSATTGYDLYNPALVGMKTDAFIVLFSFQGASAITIDAVVKESDSTNGTYTDVSGTNMLQVPATNNGTFQRIIKLPIVGRKRYIRLYVTGGAGTDFSDVIAGFVFGDPAQL